MKDEPQAFGRIVSCREVLEWAIDANLTHVLVLGVDRNGASFAASSHGYIGPALYMIERGKRHLMDIAEEYPEMRDLGPPADA